MEVDEPLVGCPAKWGARARTLALALNCTASVTSARRWILALALNIWEGANAHDMHLTSESGLWL